MYHIKNDLRSKKTSQFIYQALSTLLEEKPFEEITATEVIKRAQISRATFYRNYDSLADVLQYELDQTFIHLTRYVALHQPVKNKRVHPLALLQPFLQFWYADSVILEQILRINKQDMILTKIQFLIFKLLEKSTVDVTDNVFYDYMVQIRANIMFGVLQTWLQNQKNINPEDLYKMTVTHLKASMSARIDMDRLD